MPAIMHNCVLTLLLHEKPLEDLINIMIISKLFHTSVMYMHIYIKTHVRDSVLITSAEGDIIT